MRLAKILVSCLLTIGLLIGCSQLTAQHVAPSSAEVAKIANADTVALITNFNQKPFCTGVWVSDSVILTANHCVEGYAEMLHQVAVVKALSDDGCPDELIPMLVNLDLEVLTLAAEQGDPLAEHVIEIIKAVPPVNPDTLVIPYTVQNKVTDVGVAPTVTYHASPYARAPNEDLAVLYIDKTEKVENHSHIVLADKASEVGERVYFSGQSSGDFWSFKDGLVSSYRNDLKHAHEGAMKRDGPFMQSTVHLIPGDSGGGVFNEDGQLIGIASFTETTTEYSYFICLETIRGFLQGQHLAPVHLDPMAPDPDLSK